MFIIKIKNDPNFCGKDAADVAFINGTAKVEDRWVADWFAARPDIYTVEADEAKAEAAKADEAKADEAKAEAAKKSK